MEENNIRDFHQGKCFDAYKFLGAKKSVKGGIEGTLFTTWAPNAQEMWIIGDFNGFNVDNKFSMEKISQEGLWELFIPWNLEGNRYKYAIKTKSNEIVMKADPYSYRSELRPNTASIVNNDDYYCWQDNNWIENKKYLDIKSNPMNIYEMHLGSWKTKGEEFLTYDELSELLPEYLSNMGYNYVEFMPLGEYPLDASWGYQCTGYYSLTSRYGDRVAFKRLIDRLHEKNIGVILDWVPGHFCKDAHGLYLFDGEPTYEYEEFWKANNKGWGTFNFDLGRSEVKSFLISNAMYWMKEFHIDGLRVDAVSNMIYLNYGRDMDEWVPNVYGGDGCLEGIQFLKDLNYAIKAENNKFIMIAEESTSWPNVTGEVGTDSLGFDFKWNMGWMNDTLEYMELDPIYRKYHHNKLNFSMMYNHMETFILPYSHDEVVHGKKSMVDKIPGDYWSKFAGFRVMESFMMGHPGKKLNFMGYEYGQFIEWREYEQLEWKLIESFPQHKNTLEYIKDLNKFYLENNSLWERDYKEGGFQWIDADNCDHSIVSFIRRGEREEDTLIFISNFTSEVRYNFRLGVPYLEDYIEVFNSDEKKYGGSGETMEGTCIVPEDIEYHGMKQSVQIKVPPMATIVLGLKK